MADPTTAARAVSDVGAVCVFCGSSTPDDPRFAAATTELARAIARRGLDLVYGGGRVGLMGVLADAALEAGGRVVGVIPTGLFSREVGHTGLSQLHEVGSMHERKRLMYDLADGFIALPGGLGTLEELAEVATWTQLGLHAKPVVLLDVDGFWGPLVAQLDRMVDVGVLRQVNRSIVAVARSADHALAALSRVPEPTGKWIGEDDR
ncbi:MAG TPA: TIGR00730 family Rossman fold protein [Acidimicrobiales bacterium]|nr:TIGR00730 family Rossman fold protein [Acidimicrobiales bacterium]